VVVLFFFLLVVVVAEAHTHTARTAAAHRVATDAAARRESAQRITAAPYQIAAISRGRLEQELTAASEPLNLCPSEALLRCDGEGPTTAIRSCWSGAFA